MDQGAVDGLADHFHVVFDPTLVERTDDLLAQVGPADAIIVRNRTQVRGKLLDAAKNLKAVGRLGVGLDNIDLDACRRKGVSVFPATGANDAAVAEYVITVLFMMFRRAYTAFDAMVAGDWPRTELMGNEAGGKALGLVGFGGIARETARRAAALGMDVMAYDPYLSVDDPAWQGIKKVDFQELMRTAHAVSLHVPLTPDTRHLINEKAIAAMRKGALLVNAARGGVVDDKAVIRALKSGQLGGAALDVHEVEPLTAEWAAGMRGVKNLILTPHIAGVTAESNIRVSALTAENIRQALGG
jgi:(S)-sulfolactate dehydrogenase